VTAQPPKPESLAARLSAPPPQQMLDMPRIDPQGSSSIAPASLPMMSLAPAPQEPVSRPAQTAAAPPPAVQQPAQARPRVGGVVEQATLIRRAPTSYPALARQARVSGTVRVEAVVGTDGKVKSAKAISGPPLLRQAAVDSVKQWTYRPATLNGVPSQTTVSVDLLFSSGGR
jgi:TonB family protein